MSEAQTDPRAAYAETLADLLSAQHRHLERVQTKVGEHCQGNLCAGHADDIRDTLAECFRLRTEIEANET